MIAGQFIILISYCKASGIRADGFPYPSSPVYDPEIDDPDNGIAPGTAFEDIPEDWACPICDLGKDVFVKM